MTSMSSTIDLLQQMGSYRLWEPAATAPRQLVPTSRRGCTTTSAAPTARRSSHCSRTPSSATATPPPSNVSVLQQPSHLQYCCKGNFPASTTEKVKVYTHKIVWHYKSCEWFLQILQLLIKLKCSKKWKCYSHHTMSNHQCTMGKLKNGVNSGQLWQIISPLIFIVNLWNIAQSCLNSSKIMEYFFLKKLRKNWIKTQKAVWGVFSSQD